MKGWKVEGAAFSGFTLEQLQDRRGGRALGLGQVAGPVTLPGMEPRRAVRVALVVSEPHVRRVVAQELSADLRTEVVVEAATGRDARRLAVLDTADVVVVDRHLHDGSGLDLLAHLHSRQPHPAFIVLSPDDDEEQALRAFDLGAAGWLVYTAWVGSFVLPVLQVASGGTALAATFARRLLRRPELAPMPLEAAPVEAEHSPLSEREAEVLALAAQGLRSHEIGRQLLISADTVNAHMKSIYRKLRAHSRAQAVGIAAARGLLAGGGRPALRPAAPR